MYSKLAADGEFRRTGVFWAWFWKMQCSEEPCVQGTLSSLRCSTPLGSNAFVRPQAQKAENMPMEGRIPLSRQIKSGLAETH